MALEDRKSRKLKILDRWLGIPLVLLAMVLIPVRKMRCLLCSKANRVLIIKLSALGDTVLMLPALQLLQENLKDAQFVFLGGSSNRVFLQSLSFIKRIEALSIKGLLSLLGTRFDLVIDFDQWVRATALISSVVPSLQTIGFNSAGQYRHFAYDGNVKFDLNKHVAENFWNLAKKALERVGMPVSSSFSQDKKVAQEKFCQNLDKTNSRGRFIIVHPGCGENGGQREWTISAWKELINRIQEKDPSLKIFVTGAGAYEAEMAHQLTASGAESLVGKITFRDLLTYLAKAEKIYSCNTGVMHLASLLNDNLTAIHGPTKIGLWGPLWGGTSIASTLACAPCLTWGYDYGCSDAVCTKIITAEQVFKASYA